MTFECGKVVLFARIQGNRNGKRFFVTTKNVTASQKFSQIKTRILNAFDWKNKKADYWERRVTKESGTEEKKKSWDLTPYSQNIYTAIQYVRIFQLRL